MKLNEIQQAWIAALRSGKYHQTKRYLRDDTGYCCLGVACDLFAKVEGGTWIEPGTHESDYDDDWQFEAAENRRNTSTLASVVTRWLGLNDEVGSPGDNDETNALIHLNDNGWTFKEIADQLEAHPEQYFVETE